MTFKELRRGLDAEGYGHMNLSTLRKGGVFSICVSHKGRHSAVSTSVLAEAAFQQVKAACAGLNS